MSQFERVIARPAGTSVLATNKVIRNTYALLAMTLLFSAACAGIAMALNLPHPGMIVTMVGYFGLLWLTTRELRLAVAVSIGAALVLLVVRLVQRSSVQFVVPVVNVPGPMALSAARWMPSLFGPVPRQPRITSR